jgi:hypothetical protein
MAALVDGGMEADQFALVDPCAQTDGVVQPGQVLIVVYNDVKAALHRCHKEMGMDDVTTAWGCELANTVHMCAQPMDHQCSAGHCQGRYPDGRTEEQLLIRDR